MNDVPTADGGPGFLAFVAFFLLALALWFLMRNMNARMRRMSYRQQAAHRGKDDPQVAPGELEQPGNAPGRGADLPGDGVEPGPGQAGRNGGGSIEGESTEGGSTEDGQDPDRGR